MPVEKQVQVRTWTTTLSRGGRSPSCSPLLQVSISASWLLWDLDMPHPPQQGTTGTHQPTGTCMSGHKAGLRFNPCELVIVRGDKRVGQPVAGYTGCQFVSLALHTWALTFLHQSCAAAGGPAVTPGDRNPCRCNLGTQGSKAHLTSYGRTLIVLHSMCVESWGWDRATCQVLLFCGSEKLISCLKCDFSERPASTTPQLLS